MTVVKLYPIIAAASVVFFVWFYFAYLFHKRELAEGKESFKQILWLGILPGILLLFFWLHGFETPLETRFDFFMTTLTGLSFAAVIVYSLQQVFMTPGITRTERRSSIVFLVVFTAIIGGSMLIW